MTSMYLAAAGAVATVTDLGLVARYRHAIAHWFAPRRYRARMDSLDTELATTAVQLDIMTEDRDACAEERDEALRQLARVRRDAETVIGMWSTELTNARQQRDDALIEAETWKTAYEAGISGGAQRALPAAPASEEYSPTGVPVAAEAVLAPETDILDDDLPSWASVTAMHPEALRGGRTQEIQRALIEAALRDASVPA